MKVCYNELKPFPGYEKHVALTLETDYPEKLDPQELQGIIRPYTLPEGMTMEDVLIPGLYEGEDLRLRIYIPAGLAPNTPVVMDVHGGGYLKGSLEIDNQRCIALAALVDCIVVSVDYHLATEKRQAPDLMMDCYLAYKWIIEHAEEYGGDPSRIGLHGTSAGGNLVAALSLYLRDKNEQQPLLSVLACPGLDNVCTASTLQFGSLSSSRGSYNDIGLVTYGKLNTGEEPSYYALPGRCHDLRRLNPHMVVTAEYDPLRDEGLRYALRLLETGIPCEIISGGRVTHGFCAMPHPYTDWVHRGIAAAFRREFGMEITKI